MTNRVRKGNDVRIRWRVDRLGEPVNLEEGSIKVELIDRFRRSVPVTFSVEGNVVIIDFAAANQKTNGVHTAVLIVSDGYTTNTVDKCNIIDLVEHSCEESCLDVDAEGMVWIDVASNLAFPANGKDGIGIDSIIQTESSMESEGVNRIEITLTNGEKASFEVRNGSSGYTPQKGKDYFDGKSLYDLLVEAGLFTGPLEEFLAAYEKAAQANAAATKSADKAARTANAAATNATNAAQEAETKTREALDKVDQAQVIVNAKRLTELEGKMVKSVNGKTPDANGNVLVSGDGGAIDPSDIKDAVNEYLADNPVIVPNTYPFVRFINHRGYNTVAPENTLPAYAESYRRGFKYVECDVSFTSDNVAVLLHDSTITRTSNGEGSIADMTFADVRQYDFGSWKNSKYAGTPIPTLAEFLYVCRNLGLHPYIEIKDTASYTDEQIQSIVDMVAANQMRDKATIISFKLSYLQKVVEYEPNIRVGYVVKSVSASTITNARTLYTGTNDVFIDCDYISSSIANYATICEEAGIPMEVWCIDGTDTMARLPKYVSGITTNKIVGGESVLINNTLEFCDSVSIPDEPDPDEPETPDNPGTEEPDPDNPGTEEPIVPTDFNVSAVRYSISNGAGRTYVIYNITDIADFSITVENAADSNIRCGIQLHKQSNIDICLAKSTDPDNPSSGGFGTYSFDSGWVNAGDTYTVDQNNWKTSVTGVVLSISYKSGGNRPTIEEIVRNFKITTHNLVSY